MFIEMADNVSQGLPLLLNTVGAFHRQEAMERQQGMRCHQFLWTMEGDGVVHVDGTDFALPEKRCFFCRKGVPHRYASSGGDFVTGWVSFYGADSLLDYYRIGGYLFFDIPDFLNEATRQLEDMCYGDSTLVTRSAAGYTWAAELLEAALRKKDTLAQAVDRYLEAHYMEDIGLREIARAVDTDRYALCRGYKKQRGITVVQRLKRVRVEKAKRILRYTGCGAAETGKNCGFSDASYFTKIFKEVTGVTPGAYRAQRNMPEKRTAPEIDEKQDRLKS